MYRSEVISIKKANKLLAKLSGMKVTHTWRSYNTIIFLELGNLNKVRLAGESTIWFEVDWESSRENIILTNCFNNIPEVEEFIGGLIGKSIASISIKPNSHLEVILDDLTIIKSQLPDETDTDWTVTLSKGCYLVSETKKISLGTYTADIAQ